jgi:DMSO/TMAO reductase YedYZ molybdopterin-dependent catalytic subunit
MMNDPDQQPNPPFNRPEMNGDPSQADAKAPLVGNGGESQSRRDFLSRGGLAALSAALGGPIVFADKMPQGLIPVALAQTPDPFRVEGKEGLVYLNDRPVNAETPAHLLDDDITPAKHLFIRNNGHPPAEAEIDPDKWTLRVEGEACLNPCTFTLPELKAEFAHHSYRLVIECGGNGRSEFNPPASGNQWTVGAVGCPEWTGVRLRDVLEKCGISDKAEYIGFYGADVHLSGDPKKSPISRGVPMRKALEDEALLAFAMNGEAIPWINGHPLRLVIGGWPASVSGKWLNRIVVRDREHDGEKMIGSYRVPKYPVQPGTEVPEEDTKIIESMPVKSIITKPASGITQQLAEPLACRGQAWAGDLAVKEVFVSINFGATWEKATLSDAPNRMSWQRWSAEVKFPEVGYYEIWARAVDEKGVSQPMLVPGWNPQGYLNNACHRIAVQVV